MTEQPVRARRGEYTLISSGIDPSIVAVDDESVAHLYNFLTDEFLPTMAAAKPQQLTSSEFEAAPCVAAVSNTLGHDRFINPSPLTTDFTGLVLSRTDPESWRLYVLNARNKVGQTHRKIMSDYILQVESGQVTVARRKARFIFVDMNSATPENEPQLNTYEKALKGATFDTLYDLLTTEQSESTVERVMYERPLDAAGCQRLQDILRRTMNRCVTLHTISTHDRHAIQERARQRRQRRQSRLVRTSAA